MASSSNAIKSEPPDEDCKPLLEEEVMFENSVVKQETYDSELKTDIINDVIKKEPHDDTNEIGNTDDEIKIEDTEFFVKKEDIDGAECASSLVTVQENENFVKSEGMEVEEKFEIDEDELSNMEMANTTAQSETADGVAKNILPETSKSKYNNTYKTYMDWCSAKKTTDIGSETILLKYFAEEAMKKKASTLWATYSMLKSTLNINHQINISIYPKLLAYLKKQSVGYQPKKSRVFTEGDIDKFIDEAPKEYLPHKVALIIGICGGCRTDELFRMKLGDIECTEKRIIITIPDSKIRRGRAFIINNQTWIAIIQEYVHLHKPVDNERFFLKVRYGSMTRQPFGHNSLALFPRNIATYLKLDSIHEFTGHCFRRTAATLLVNNRLDGRWKMNCVPEVHH